jgi:hypothetical protein
MASLNNTKHNTGNSERESAERQTNCLSLSREANNTDGHRMKHVPSDIMNQESMQRLLHREQGQTLVEFALSLVMTLTLVFGLIEFSRVVFANSVVQAAAQTGARAGIIDVADITPAVEEKLTGLDVEKATISYTEPAFRTVQVEVVYQFEFIVPLVDTLMGGDVELHGSASMVGQ